MLLIHRHAAELHSLRESLGLQHEGALEAEREELNQKLLEAKSSALEDLDKAKLCSESELQALRQTAAQDCSALQQENAEKLASREQAHALEISRLREEHAETVTLLETESRKDAKAAAQQLLQEKHRASADIKKLQVYTARILQLALLR